MGSPMKNREREVLSCAFCIWVLQYMVFEERRYQRQIQNVLFCPVSARRSIIVNLGQNAITVLEKRYLVKDENGNDIPQDPRWQPMVLAEKIHEEGRQFPKMYIACGEADPLYPSAVELQEKMKDLGADVTWVSRPGYAHEWRLWDEQVEAFLNWIPRTDFYAGSKRRI